MRDEGDLQSAIETEVESYNGQDSQHEVTGLTPGLVYRFAYLAVNEFGTSVQSEVLTIAASALPNAPISLAVDWSKSSKTALWIDWAEPSELPASLITGYILEMDQGFIGS